MPQQFGFRNDRKTCSGYTTLYDRDFRLGRIQDPDQRTSINVGDFIFVAQVWIWKKRLSLILHKINGLLVNGNFAKSMFCTSQFWVPNLYGIH